MPPKRKAGGAAAKKAPPAKKGKKGAAAAAAEEEEPQPETLKDKIQQLKAADKGKTKKHKVDQYCRFGSEVNFLFTEDQHIRSS